VAAKKDGGEETATRYSQAGLELALAAKAEDALAADFALFEAALADSADLREAVHSPLIDSESKSKALAAVAAKIGCSKLGCDLIGVAAKNGRAGALAGIAKEYRRQLAAHRGARSVEIVSAQPLAADELKKILDGLAQALGGTVEAVTRVDESLIGGFIVQAGSRQFDASLRTKLSSLKLALKA
jgi:F-type H+-transporting ATPase subunit delta